jgi:aminoglycoside phosphotransferase (APT) family kinase protein
LRDWYLTEQLGSSDLVDVEAIRSALDRGANSVEPVAPTLLHGDFHAGNVLRDDGHVTGVVDWTCAVVGDPRFDAMYCALDLALFSSIEVADAFVAAYEQLRGPVVDGWFFALLAAATALPDPMEWASSYQAHGVTIDPDGLRARFVAWVARALAEVTPQA